MLEAPLLHQLVDALRTGPARAADFDPDLVKLGLAEGIIAQVPGYGPATVCLTAKGLEEAKALRAQGEPLLGLDITETGLRIHRILTKQEVSDLLVRLQRVRHIYHAALADVLTHARTHHGEDFVNETLDQLEFPFEDVQKAQAIQAVPQLLREQSGLSAEHIYVLGRQFPEDTNEQEKWAALAGKHELTALALKRSIQTGTILTDEKIHALSGRSSGIPVINGLITVEFRRWLNQVGGRNVVLGWNKTQKLALLDEFEPLLGFAEAVKASMEEG